MNNLKLNNCSMKLFLLKISEAKAIKISVLYGLPVEKYNILLNACYAILYSKGRGMGFKSLKQ